MCVTIVENSNLQWITSYPEEAGEYIWIAQWSDCGCVSDAGLCSVDEIEDAADFREDDYFAYRASNGKALRLYWCGPEGYVIPQPEKGANYSLGTRRRPWKYTDGTYRVTAFAKIDLKPGEEQCDDVPLPAEILLDTVPPDTNDTQRPPSI